MSLFAIKDSTLTAIADAIREKTGGTDAIRTEDMAAEIQGIEAGGGSSDPILQNKTATPRATEQTITADNGFDGLSSVTVEGDTNLVAENIAEGVSIFGVMGTHSGGGSTGGENKLAQLANDTITEVKAADLTGVTKIKQYMFYYCSSLLTVEIPSGVTMIGNYAFTNCFKLRDVVLPEGLVSIGDDAFSNCNASGFISLLIPSTVTNIGKSAFHNCYKLKTLIVKSKTPPTLGSNALMYVPAQIIVPAGSGDAYKSATNWSAYASQIVEEEGGEEEGNWLFKDEVFTSYNRTDLPPPDGYISLTLFVDGEEIATSTVTSDLSGTVVTFNTEDYRIYFIYDASTGHGWHFHPIDSMVQSGTVSIRIND